MEPNHKHHHQPPFLTLLQKPSSMCRKEYHHDAGVFHPSDLVTFRRQQRRTVASSFPSNTQIPAILKKRQQKQQEVPPTNQDCHPSSPSLPLTGVSNSSSPAIGSSALRQHPQECYCPAAASMMSIISSLQEPLEKQQAERDKVTNDLWMNNEGFGDWIPPEILAALEADVAPKDNSPPPSPPQQQVKEFPRRSLKDLSPEKPQMRKGHWIHEEHRAFLEGMMLYPKQWKKIAFNFVRTRTATQVASHHQKFVLGLAGTGKRRWPKKQTRQSSPEKNCITK